MSSNDSTSVAITPVSEKLTKKALTADHPTWCPGCGDFAVLAAFYKVLERRQLPHENIVTLAGIGCSSRFPYFVNLAWRPLHSRARRPAGFRGQSGSTGSSRLSFRRRWGRVFDWRQSSRSRRPQKHPDNLCHHG